MTLGEVGSRAGPLWRAIALRMTLVAVSLTVLLAAFYFLHYRLDTPGLRRATLEAQVAGIVAALRSGHDPAAWPGYRRYPANYGFRVFIHRARTNRTLVGEANAELLPSLGEDSNQASDLHEGFESAAGTPDASGQDEAARDRWLLTDRDQEGDRAYWIEAVMIGDPAGQWRGVIVQEMVDHVMVPVLSIVPLLTLAMFLTVRHALRPLGRIADQARALGQAAATGQTLSALPSAGLAREVRVVVDALNTMLAKLDRSLRTQRQFTADAAHELRTPLAILQLEASQLAPQAGSRRVQEEIADLAALLDRLLRFAQTEDAMTAERLPVDVVAATRRVCEDLAPAAAARDQLLTFEAVGPRPVVLGHAALIDSAVRNVVENALKYSASGSTVAIVVGPGARVTVDDEGPGIAPAERVQVFDRFWRASHTRVGGAGLGLPMAQRIARLHGGDVTIDTAPSGGARFTLSFAPPGETTGVAHQSRVSVRS